MRNDKRCASKSSQGLFHDFPCRNIQMVCRFIQYQEIWLLQEKHEQCQPGPFSPGEEGYRFKYMISPEEEHAQQVTCFSFPHIKIIFNLFQYGVLAVQPVKLLGTDLVLPGFQSEESAVCPLIAHDELEQSGLTRGCSGPDQPHPLALPHVHCQVLKDDMITIGRGNMHNIKHFFCTFSRLFKLEMQRLPVYRFFDPFQTVKLRLSASGLFLLNSRLIFSNIFFRFPDMLLLLFIRPFLKSSSLRALTFVNCV